MNNYLMKTEVSVKSNEKKWCIDSDLIKDLYIEAENLEEAFLKYKEIIEKNNYVVISNNGLKQKTPMYKDLGNNKSKQIGFVITGKTNFYDKYNKEVQKYIDLWVEVLEVSIPNFNSFLKVVK